MSFIDLMRTKYKSLPMPARRLVAAIVFLAPDRLKYGKRYSQTLQTISDTSGNARAAAGYVQERLRSVVSICAEKSSYYHPQLSRCGLTTSSDGNFDFAKFSELPILDKDLVRENLETIATIPLENLDMVTTSGSSGVPMKFYLDKTRSVVEWAFLVNAWSEIGFRPSMKRAALRGFEISNVDAKPWEYEPGLKELRLSPFHMNDHWLEKYVSLIEDYGIEFLHGYPSAIEILSKYVLKSGLTRFANRIKGAILTSEAVYAHQAEIIKTAFPNIKLLSFYGQSEKVLFATSSPDDIMEFRFNSAYGFPELVDNSGLPITKAGQRGRIVGTGLQFTGLPFLRYDTGDVADLVEPATAENGYQLRVRNITPRRGQEHLVGKNNELISIAALNLHSDAYNAVDQFVIEQTLAGEATIKCVLAAGKTEEDAQKFAAEFGRKTKGSLIFNLIIQDDIPAGARGKRHWLRQSLNLSELL